MRYHPWGADRFTSGSTPTSFKYTGQRQEAGIGLYFYGARWYDPALGRFTQPDTVVPSPGDAQTLNKDMRA
ncbi:MAG: RHS repeat-associated core domain-containing protein [Caldilineaceae bacterium]